MKKLGRKKIDVEGNREILCARLLVAGPKLEAEINSGVIVGIEEIGVVVGALPDISLDVRPIERAIPSSEEEIVAHRTAAAA
jgi:hypothetical protein